MNYTVLMKGIIFRSFETFVSERFGDGIVDQVWEQPALSTGGAFTTIGNYPHSDLITLVAMVSEKSGLAASALIRDFGEALFGTLGTVHSDLVAQFKTPIALLSVIETVIHRDVRKIYNNTELPRFDVIDQKGDEFLCLDYSSARPFADLAEGLILGCLSHYNVKDSSYVERDDIKPDGTHSRFKISINSNGQRQENA